MSGSGTHVHSTGSHYDCVLCRSKIQGMKVFKKAMQRQVHWPKPKQVEKPLMEEPGTYASLDDAFSAVLQTLSSASKQCKQYYTCDPSRCKDQYDSVHCSKFHTPYYTQAQRNNPMVRSENVHVQIAPGTYAISAGEWGTQSTQTHMVHVQPGQTVSLDFCL